MSSPAGKRIHKTDIAIIGAGPVGLFAVFECGMLGLRCHVVDALDSIGGQCTALYPDKPIYDIAGYPRIDAGELVARLEEQAAPFGPVYHLNQRAQALTRQEDRWLVETHEGTRIEAAAVMIAGGGGAFGPNRPPLPGLQHYEGRSVFYSVQRREALRGKRVVVAGGGDSAVDWAIALSDIAAHVMVVHRRERFRAAPESAKALRRLADSGKVELVIPYQLAGLEGADGKLSAVHVRTVDGDERQLEVDILLPFFGLASDLGSMADWGLDLKRGLICIDPATCETSKSGVYAIGDIATYPGKLKLILCGFSEGAMAAHAAFAIARPDEALHFEYSTMKGIPPAD